jgi:hypothetical protein
MLVRNVLSGKEKGPELPHIIYFLNKEEVKERLEK